MYLFACPWAKNLHALVSPEVRAAGDVDRSLFCPPDERRPGEQDLLVVPFPLPSGALAQRRGNPTLSGRNPATPSACTLLACRSTRRRESRLPRRQKMSALLPNMCSVQCLPSLYPSLLLYMLSDRRHQSCIASVGVVHVQAIVVSDLVPNGKISVNLLVEQRVESVDWWLHLHRAENRSPVVQECDQLVIVRLDLTCSKSRKSRMLPSVSEIR